MEHAEQVSHIKTLLARLDSGTNVDAGGVRYNPTSSYTDRELARIERREFFDTHPQMVGLSGDLPEVGSFMTQDDLGTPMLLVRSPSGRFRAFVNSCRHRGVVIEAEPRGRKRRFACPFHNWTYDADGALVGLPKSDHFGELDRDDLGLVELPAVERHGLLWVHPQPGGTLDPDALLGDELAADFAGWDFGKLQWLGCDTYEVGCNWKLAMDTFGETYHFPVLHSDTLSNDFYGNVQCYDEFGRHHRLILCRRSIEDARERPPSEWDITRYGLPVYWLFPNVQLIPSREVLFLVRAYPHPTEPGRHTSQISFYLRPGIARDDAEFDFMAEASRAFSNVIRDEDYVMSASQQRSANSGALENVVFGRNEPALHHFHNTYRAALGQELLPLHPTP
ncbi:MAG: aromatic ring-hydroxylating dioxygenase subunit alpha [Acidimicrobiaceae bacterium]|nr:aromatic ring-hydroxylating dioxygenase subunit alpha [Acidimicrobiaceae bacterium]MCY3608769.1 aromatic ring-hydroxylating dioxygenase subunit alpha [Acidimicrobiaceae bacterium]MDE0133258.1 aromatic ring-hydroxylating dioxygenase subunit alpha [Acidimicrobiaceae bacterium]